MDSSTEIGWLDIRSKSYVQIIALANLVVKELLKTSSTLPPVLKANSEEIVEIGTPKTLFAKWDRIGNL